MAIKVKSKLIELCDDSNTFTVAVREHWLTENNLPVVEFLLCQRDLIMYLQRLAIWWSQVPGKTFVSCVKIQ